MVHYKTRYETGHIATSTRLQSLFPAVYGMRCDWFKIMESVISKTLTLAKFLANIRKKKERKSLASEFTYSLSQKISAGLGLDQLYSLPFRYSGPDLKRCILKLVIRHSDWG
jgi:hypothetical protein